MARLVQIISNDPASRSTTYLADDGNTYTLTGDLGARANNPGNISPSGDTARGVYQSQFGAIGYIPSTNGPPVAVFPDLPSGQAAQGYLWHTPAYRNRTLDQAASAWAASPYAEQLRQAAGVGGTTRVRDLTPEQMQAVIATQNVAEGSSNLRVTDANGEPVDEAIFTGTHPVPPLGIPQSSAERLSAIHDQNADWPSAPPLPIPRPSPPVVAPVPMPARPAALMPAAVINPLPAPAPLVPTPAFNPAPPNLPLNAPLPPGDGQYYGPASDHWGPRFTPVAPPASQIERSPPQTAKPDLLDQLAERAAVRSGSQKTTSGIAGTVQMPAGVVPKSVQQDTAAIAAMPKTIANPAWATWDATYGSGAPKSSSAPNDTLMDIHDKRDDGAIAASASALKKIIPAAPPKTILVQAPVVTKAPPKSAGSVKGASDAGNILGDAFNFAKAKAADLGNAVKSTASSAASSVATSAPKIAESAKNAVINALTSTVAGRTAVIDPMIASVFTNNTVAPPNRAAVIAQQSSDQRGQEALRKSGMLDSFGMVR